MLIQQLLRHSERRVPQLTAIDDGAEKITYSQLVTRVEELCDLLLRHGMKSGQHLAVYSTNNIDYVAIYFACAELGLVIVPMNAHLKEEEIQWILTDCTPGAVIVEADFTGRFDEALNASGCNDALRFVMGSAEGDWVALSGKDGKSGNRVKRAKADAKDDALVVQMYTSGTTGRPKGVMLSHTNITSLVAAWAQEMPLISGTSRFMQATPLFHVGGLMVCLSSIAAGATLFLLPKFEPQLACNTLVKNQVTDTLLVPAMIQRLLLLPDIDQIAFPHLTTMVYGASLMPTSVLLQAHEVFECRFLQGYGLTETSGAALCLRPEDHDFSPAGHNAKRLAAAGRTIACCEVRVADANGASVKVDTVGEILVRGTNVMLGYWHNPAATAETIVDGWLKTGDLGHMDSDGYIYVVGRCKDMIDYSGENVYPAEVENVLTQHPKVAEVAVIGLPHATTGEEVVAVVIPASGHAAATGKGNTPTDTSLTPASLKAQSLAEELTCFSRERLANFKCPSRYIFADTLPRTPAGKIQKHILVERYS